MSKQSLIRRLRLGAFLVLLGLASPAFAERLAFDHRLVPELKAVLDSGNGEMIEFNGSNPSYVTDVIAVRGRSARDWNEALVIIARAPGKKVRTATDWLEELRGDAQRRCNAEMKIVEQGEGTILFERQAPKCPGNYPRNALYLVVQGKSSLFLLAVLSRDDLSETSRSKWLALFRSAELK